MGIQVNATGSCVISSYTTRLEENPLAAVSAGDLFRNPGTERLGVPRLYVDDARPREAAEGECSDHGRNQIGT